MRRLATSLILFAAPASAAEKAAPLIPPAEGFSMNGFVAEGYTEASRELQFGGTTVWLRKGDRVVACFSPDWIARGLFSGCHTDSGYSSASRR